MCSLDLGRACFGATMDAARSWLLDQAQATQEHYSSLQGQDDNERDKSTNHARDRPGDATASRVARLGGWAVAG